MTEEQRDCLIFIGPPTAGKTSHTNSFSRRLGLEKPLRGREIAPDLVGQYEPQRLMVPDELYVPRLRDVLRGLNGKHQVFDNIPRTERQAEVVCDWSMYSSWGLHVIVLNLPIEEVLSRAAVRENCPPCNEPYHPAIKPSRNIGVCDICTGPLERRSGDGPVKVTAAYKRYMEERMQIMTPLRFIAEIHEIDAMGTISAVEQRITQTLTEYAVEMPQIK